VDEAALFAAIAAAPDDDGPRLVLADWLQQRGDPWGELIVLGCELAHRDAPELRERHDELLAERFFDPRLDHTFERGFCTRLESNELASAAGPQYMMLREALLGDATAADVRALAAWPLLSRIEKLEIDAMRDQQGLGREVPSVVAAARSLRVLELMRTDVSRTELEAMFALPHAAQLQRLTISANASLAESLADLAWPALAELEIGACAIMGGDVAALLDGGRLAGLRTLALSYNDISDDGAQALAAQPFTRLATLELEGNELTQRGIAMLAASPHLRGLRRLALGGGFDVDIDPALPALATAFPELETLRVESRFALPHLPALARPLHELSLSLDTIEPATLAHLLASPPLRTLHSFTLALRDDAPGDDIAAVIAAADLPALAWLVVQFEIGESGVRAFARAPHLPASCQMTLSTEADLGELQARYRKLHVY